MTRARLLLLAAAWAATAGAADWPQWRGPQRNSTSAETGIAQDWKTNPPRALWKANVGIGFSGIAVAGDLAITLGNRDETDTVYAFDAATGAVKWKHAYPCTLGSLRHEGGPYATPTVDGDALYILGKEGQFFCLELATGKVKWETNVAKATGSPAPNYGCSSSALVVGDKLVLNTGSAGAAFDKATGKLLWKSGSGKPGHASPVAFTLGGRSGVAIITEKHLVGLDPATGKIFWRQALPEGGRIYKIADPMFLGDQVFVTSSYGDFCAMYQVDGDTVREVWKGQGLVSKFLNPVLTDGHIVGGHRERAFRCIDPKDGAVKWEQRFAGSVILLPDSCLILTTKGELLLAKVTAKAYQELARTQALDGKCWTAPALANARIYCRNAKGDIACLDLTRR